MAIVVESLVRLLTTKAMRFGGPPHLENFYESNSLRRHFQNKRHLPPPRRKHNTSLTIFGTVGLFNVSYCNRCVVYLVLFRFVLRQWLTMLSISSYSYLPSDYLLWWSACSFYSFKKLCYLLLIYNNSLNILNWNPLYALLRFSPSLCLVFSFS